MEHASVHGQCLGKTYDLWTVESWDTTLTDSRNFPVSALVDVHVIFQVHSDPAAVGTVVKGDLRP